MNSRLMIASLLSLAMFLAGCDNATSPTAVQKSSKVETSEKKLADVMNRAEQGQAQAQFNLGSMYKNGEGAPKDISKAFDWYQKSAMQGNADAQYNLGVMYNNGEGVSKDSTKAFEWWQKAAAQGNVRAQVEVGRAYESGSGVKSDPANAFDWYLKAATQGNAEAQATVAGDYLIGKIAGIGVVDKDNNKGFEWARKSAEQGNGVGQAILAMCYHNGSGVPKDEVKAFEWMLKSAAYAGNAQAQNEIGQYYETGSGTAKDFVLAYAWYNLAAAKMSDMAIDILPKQRLAKLEERLTPSQRAEAQRLSSSWKRGQTIFREGQPSNGGALPDTLGKFSKKGTGTLFLVNTAGQAITNDHVVRGCGELRIEGRDGLAKVVIEDAVNDLALVQVPGEAKASAAITADAGKLRQGEDVVVFGFPLNAVLSSGGNLTPGVVSALTGLGNNTNQIQITAPIQPGSSGSPVLNKKGEVVGMVLMKLSDSGMAKATGQIGQNVNFAVNGQTLRTFFDTHKVIYRNGAGFFMWDKSAADLADEARKWTLVVECWK